jgi:hypothetical protein
MRTFCSVHSTGPDQLNSKFTRDAQCSTWFCFYLATLIPGDSTKKGRLPLPSDTSGRRGTMVRVWAVAAVLAIVSISAEVSAGSTDSRDLAIPLTLGPVGSQQNVTFSVTPGDTKLPVSRFVKPSSSQCRSNDLTSHQMLSCCQLCSRTLDKFDDVFEYESASLVACKLRV